MSHYTVTVSCTASERILLTLVYTGWIWCDVSTMCLGGNKEIPVSSWKEMWNTINNCDQIWSHPRTFGEHLLSNLDMIVFAGIPTIGILVYFGVLTFNDWRKQRRLEIECTLWLDARRKEYRRAA